MRLLVRLMIFLALSMPVAGAAGWAMSYYTVTGRSPLQRSGPRMPEQRVASVYMPETELAYRE